MAARDFLILMICCLAWAGNFVISTWALGGDLSLFPSAIAVPPFMLAAIRALIVLLIMFPFLRQKPPKYWGRLLIICACVGPIHLAFLYTGLISAPASASAIVSQMLIPFAALLSVFILKEPIGRIRCAAIIGAFIGTMIMVYEAGQLRFDRALLYIVAAYISLAIGTVTIRKVGDVDWRQYVAWMAAMVLPVLGGASLIFETNHQQVLQRSFGPLLIAATYAAIFVSIFAHGQYFNLLKKYAVAIVVPITLVVPVFATILGVIFLKETLYLRYFIGAAFILPCVYIIARRTPSRSAQPDL